MSQQDRDDLTGTETTGHDWDGIRELDTPLPRWWLWTLYLTIIWGIGYTIAYPAWPMLTSATTGVLGYSSRAEVAQAITEIGEERAGMTTRIAQTDFTAIAADRELTNSPRPAGPPFSAPGAPSGHGAGAAGAVGYPNLIDDDWLWGGDADAIAASVRHGVRWEYDDDTRYSEMPAFGDDGILSRAEIAAVADHVLSLSGAAEPSADGAALYADNCAACHGDAGLGDREQGAPNLADAIWLYGAERATLIETITHARFGVMPAWGGRLTEAEIRQVAHYVHSLGGGE